MPPQIMTLSQKHHVPRGNCCMSRAETAPVDSKTLQKCPTGIHGLDELTLGGLPRNRTCLVCGAAGCGKTTLAMEFLVRGALEYDEPGLFVSFEESAEELTQNFASMGFDLNALQAQEKLSLDFVHLERSEIRETGEFDLDGLFVRLGFGIDSIGAKRVVLDTIEVLFSALPNETILRAELRRLFRWLKQKGVTAIVTGEKGEKTLTRHGLEEYVADCVIFLDHRIQEQLSTRRLRIVKYRGSTHGSDEYPFLIGSRGISVLPVTSVGLEHEVSDERISTGVPALDAMLGGGGFFRGSTVLISGTAGTGKTSLVSSIARAVCERGERCLYFGFEESSKQILRNMASIGLDLKPWVDKGLLRFHNHRATAAGLEMHLLQMHEFIREFEPSTVVFDPLSNLTSQGTGSEVRSMAMRLIDSIKSRGATAVFTSLTSGAHHAIEQTELEISSLIDTWILLRGIEFQGERNRGIFVLKSRGMAHSNQIREFIIDNQGISLVDAYLGAEGVLTGSARANQEIRERLEVELRRQRIGIKRKELERKRQAVKAQIEALQAAFEAEADELEYELSREELSESSWRNTQKEMSRRRQAKTEGDGGLESGTHERTG
jgi:circadian clock protein KaiC